MGKPNSFLSKVGVYFPLLNYFLYKVAYRGTGIAVSAEIIKRGGQLIFGKHNMVGKRTRLVLSRHSRIRLEDNAWIGDDVLLEPLPDREIVLGEGTSVQDRCRLIGDVVIGRGVLLAPNVFISSGNHFFDLVPYLPIRVQDRMVATDPRHEELRSSKVIIEDDCWIGTNVVISRGVLIGKGAIIGANSVVTQNVEPYTVQGGVPAKFLRERLTFAPPSLIRPAEQQHLPYFYSGFGALERTKAGADARLRVEKTFVVCLRPNGYNEATAMESVYIVLEALSPAPGLTLIYGCETRAVLPGTAKYVFQRGVHKPDGKCVFGFDVPLGDGDRPVHQFDVYVIESGLEA